MTFEGVVVGHVGAWAVTQTALGLLPILDSDGALVAGDGVLLDVRSLDESTDDPGPCAIYEVEQAEASNLLLLRSPAEPCAPPIPIVAPDHWPEVVLVRAHSPSPEVSEGSENFGPPPPARIT